MQAAGRLALRTVSMGLKRQASSSTAAQGSSRRMVYPYTFSAKIAQFPYRFHYDSLWLVKWAPFCYGIVLYLFWQIQKLANSPENKAKWKEIREKEAAAHADH